jgi:hypothetical protein
MKGLMVLIMASLTSSLLAQTNNHIDDDKAKGKLDSLPSIKPNFSKIDSLKNTINSAGKNYGELGSKLDSIKYKATAVDPLMKIDSIQSTLTQKINRLSSLPNPDKLLIKSLDSMRGELDSLKSKITSPVGSTTVKVNQTQSQINSKINAIEGKVNEQLGKLSVSGVDMGSLNLSTGTGLDL